MSSTQQAQDWFVEWLATPETGTTEVVVARAGIRAGGTFPAHSHDREEVLVVVTGTGRYTIGEETAALSAGDTVVIPAGALHVFEAEDDMTALAVLPAGARIFAPDGSELSL
jgi:quercetin dioxygenase-like cupin family protein